MRGQMASGRIPGEGAAASRPCRGAGRFLRIAAVLLLPLTAATAAEPAWGPRPVQARAGSGPKFCTQIQQVLFMDRHWYLQGWPDLVTLDARDGSTVAWELAPEQMRGPVVWHEFPTIHQGGRYLFIGDRNGAAAVYEAAPRCARASAGANASLPATRASTAPAAGHVRSGTSEMRAAVEVHHGQSP